MLPYPTCTPVTSTHKHGLVHEQWPRVPVGFQDRARGCARGGAGRAHLRPNLIGLRFVDVGQDAQFVCIVSQ